MLNTSSHYGLISVAGLDAEKFLQGQLTCNVAEVDETRFSLGACCNPQGRIIATFRLFKFQGAYYLFLPRESMALALNHLQKYAIFSKVKLEEDTSEGTLNIIQQQLDYTDDHAWQLQNIHAGIAEIYPETSGQFTPHDINYPKLNGVSFNKGCYTGQEIIARMEYRGKLKQRLYQAEFKGNTPPKPGDLIYAPDDKQVGVVINIAKQNEHHHALLVVLQDAYIGNQLFLAPQNFTQSVVLKNV